MASLASRRPQIIGVTFTDFLAPARSVLCKLKTNSVSIPIEFAKHDEYAIQVEAA